MSALQSIVYVSTATHEMSEAELESLLLESRRLNTESRITGMLLYSGGGFMQCFEGAPEAVQRTYKRIRGSGQHHGLIELADEPTEARSFPDFQMGFVRAARSQALKLSTALWRSRLGAHTPSADDASGIALLESFWQQAAARS